MGEFQTSRGSAAIIYEDRDVLVFSKPEGLLSEKAEGSSELSVLDFISDYTGNEVFPIHRLDRSTSGVMITAKRKEAASAISAMMASGSTRKEYIAAVLGITPDSGRLENELFFDRRTKKAYVVEKKRRGAKHAVLEYERLSTDIMDGEAISILKIRLFTGRTHQIRVQLANIGHPLAGDGRYGGGRVKYPAALRSHRITFAEASVNNGYFAHHPFGKYLSEHGYAVTEG